VRGHPIINRVQVTTTSGIHAPNMAEYVLMMMLTWSHRLRNIFEHQQRGEWPKIRWELFAPAELRYASIGIIGYGSIGREVARMARAFGMRVLAMKRDIFDTLDVGWQLPGVGDEESSSVDRLYAPDELRALLAESDYIVIAAPLTDQTRGMFGADELHRMKKNAVLINIARGPIIQEAALVEALREGAIGGAILDVFDKEPLPADHPLWKLPNAIISPHVSGFSHDYDERAMALFAANLGRYLENDRLINVVDPVRGY
jgi:phosphoglycerate dehydrogenase-like enzyme